MRYEVTLELWVNTDEYGFLIDRIEELMQYWSNADQAYVNKVKLIEVKLVKED